jgi:hypothetical protein
MNKIDEDESRCGLAEDAGSNLEVAKALLDSGLKVVDGADFTLDRVLMMACRRPRRW